MHIDHVKKYPHTRAIALVSSLLGLVACTLGAAGPMQGTLPIVQVLVGQHKATAELANTDLTRQIGLMNRKEMAPDTGMLFVFKRSETQCMWMKNTLIDLDVAFADENGRILNVEQMNAGSSDIHCSTGNAKLALEMNRNWFSERGLDSGAVLQLPANATGH